MVPGGVDFFLCPLVRGGGGGGVGVCRRLGAGGDASGFMLLFGSDVARVLTGGN